MEALPRDVPALNAALDALLADHPHALVAAITQDGLFTEAARLPITSHRVASGRSAIDLVVPADRIVIADAWARTRQLGAARAVVHLRSAPDVAVVMEFIDQTDRFGVYAAVVLSEAGDDAAVEQTPTPRLPPRVARIDTDDMGVILDVDARFEEMFGWPRGELLRERQLELIHADDQDRIIVHWMEMLATPHTRMSVRARHRTARDSWLWVELIHTNMLDAPDVGAVVGEIIDISDEMAMQESLRVREELFRRLAETVPVGLLQVDEGGHIVYANDRFYGIFGSEPADNVEEQLAPVENAAALFASLAEVMVERIDRDHEVRVARSSGDVRLCTFSIRPLAGERGALICVTDITESARLRQELERRATYDALTGCYNRSSIVEALEAQLATQLAAATTGIGVLFFDLDRFKDVNDTIGHAAGDALLRTVVERARSGLRPDDLIGRVGGDEFLVVCPRVASADDVMAIARRAAAAISVPMTFEGHTIECSASIGAVFADEPQSADEVLARADAAMYESKRRHHSVPVLAGASVS